MVAFLAASLTLLVPLRPLAAPHLVEPSGRTHLVMPTPVSGPRSVQSSICWRSASLSDSRCARSGAVIAAVRSAQDDDGATMKRADLPSGEELTVASFLGGAACAFVWRHILGGSAVFGALIGVLITRRIAYQPTKAGAYVREAGWATHKQYLALRARSKAASEWAMTEAHQLGLPTPSELGSKLLQLMRKVHSFAVERAPQQTCGWVRFSVRVSRGDGRGAAAGLAHPFGAQ
jgi:hypothetical protein